MSHRCRSPGGSHPQVWGRSDKVRTRPGCPRVDPCSQLMDQLFFQFSSAPHDLAKAGDGLMLIFAQYYLCTERC